MVILFNWLKIDNLDEERGLKCFRFAMLLSIGEMILFFFKYNFQYHYYVANFVLLPGLACLSFLYYKHTKSDLALPARYLMFLVLSTVLSYMIWVAGGYDAPGIFWFAAVPLTGGVLFGIRGLALGVIHVGVSMTLFALGKEFGYYVNIIPSHEVYIREKVFNLIVFTLYAAGMTIFFLKSESESQKISLQKKNEVESLLRVIMHDLSSPLNQVLMGVDLIGKKYPEVKEIKYLGYIDQAAHNMEAVLDKVREMYSIRDGKKTLNLQAVDLNQIMIEAVAAKRNFAEQKGVEIEIEKMTSDVRVDGDPVALKTMVLGNIISNAVKFSPANSKIVVRSHLEGKNAVIEVQDFGVGIPKEIQGKLFDFHKATSRKGTSGESGTGYGMPLAYEFTKKMNGQLTLKSIAKSESGQQLSGTTFYVKLNLAA